MTLDEIRALWEADRAEFERTGFTTVARADFIAAARELVPKLLAVARVAAKVSDCVGEFGKDSDGACACHEWFSALDEALAALEAP